MTEIGGTNNPRCHQAMMAPASPVTMSVAMPGIAVSTLWRDKSWCRLSCESFAGGETPTDPPQCELKGTGGHHTRCETLRILVGAKKFLSQTWRRKEKDTLKSLNELSDLWPEWILGVCDGDHSLQDPLWLPAPFASLMCVDALMGCHWQPKFGHDSVEYCPSCSLWFFSIFVDNDCGTLFPKMPCEEIESLDGSGLSVPMFLQANFVCQGSFACFDPNNSVCSWGFSWFVCLSSMSSWRALSHDTFWTEEMTCTTRSRRGVSRCGTITTKKRASKEWWTVVDATISNIQPLFHGMALLDACHMECYDRPGDVGCHWIPQARVENFQRGQKLRPTL